MWKNYIKLSKFKQTKIYQFGERNWQVNVRQRRLVLQWRPGRMAHLWKIASIGKDVIDREKESHLPREKEYWVRAACSFIFPYPR